MSRTLSLWINQSESIPCQRVRKCDKPARQEEQKKKHVNVKEKRDKPELKKILLYFKWRIFLSNDDVFIEETQKVLDYMQGC